LYRSLVRDRQVAAECTAFTFDLSKGSDLLVLDVTARPEASAEQLESEVHAVVDDIATNGARPEELERALAVIETEFLAAMQVAADRADKLSMFATYFRNPELVNDQLRRYTSVDLAAVNDFMTGNLVPANRAALLYVPRPDAHQDRA
jgi:predicted Zn-dependent peptidase